MSFPLVLNISIVPILDHLVIRTRNQDLGVDAHTHRFLNFHTQPATIYYVIIISPFLSTGLCSSLLCGRTKEVEVGGSVGVGAALALALVRPASSPAPPRTPCQLRLTAPDATAFIVRLIDVKVSFYLFLFSSFSLL